MPTRKGDEMTDDEMIESAQVKFGKGETARAFFYITLVAIKQLKRLADAQAQIASRLDKWDKEDSCSVITLR